MVQAQTTITTKEQIMNSIDVTLLPSAATIRADIEDATIRANIAQARYVYFTQLQKELQKDLDAVLNA